MTPLLGGIGIVAGFCGALWTGYMITTRLSMLMYAAELAEGCTTCYYLGRIPFGPPYWLLRQHLRKTGQRPDETVRQPAQ